MNIYDWALMAQGACNLRGLLNDVPRFLQAVSEEISSGEWTGGFAKHPAIILLAEQIYYLTGNGRRYDQAYAYCKAQAGKTAA
jgi:hypothetical protein